jgi:hypothetical protein
VSAAAACVRHPAAWCLPLSYTLFIINLSLLMYVLVPVAAACVKHPAGHAIIICLLFDYFILII